MTFSNKDLRATRSLRIALGAVFVYAASSNWKPPGSYSPGAIGDYKILPDWAVNPWPARCPGPSW